MDALVPPSSTRFVTLISEAITLPSRYTVNVVVRLLLPSKSAPKLLQLKYTPFVSVFPSLSVADMRVSAPFSPARFTATSALSLYFSRFCCVSVPVTGVLHTADCSPSPPAFNAATL